MSETRTLVERLRSRDWEDRQHRKLREEAAAEIERLTRELDDAKSGAINLARNLAKENKHLQSAARVAQLEDWLKKSGDAHYQTKLRVSALEAVVRELVRLKDLKDTLPDDPVTWQEADLLNFDDYARDKPLAWAAARQVISGGEKNG